MIKRGIDWIRLSLINAIWKHKDEIKKEIPKGILTSHKATEHAIAIIKKYLAQTKFNVDLFSVFLPAMAFWKAMRKISVIRDK